MEISLYQLYRIMLENMGHQKWWPAESENEIIVGAILVQNTNWNNVVKSLSNLKKLTDFKTDRIMSLDESSLIDAIRQSGFYHQKSKTIKVVFNWLISYSDDHELIKKSIITIRNQLLSIKGIGHETADAIRLYVFDEKTFISDRYAQKLFSYLGLLDINSYNKLNRYIQLNEEFSLEDAKEFHGLIVEFGKVYLKNKELFDTSFLVGYKITI